MSNQVNTNLMELASDHIDFWQGTLRAEVLEGDLERNDMESLSQHILESAQEMAIQEQQDHQEKMSHVNEEWSEDNINKLESEDIF